jgi:hypothetical protein
LTVTVRGHSGPRPATRSKEIAMRSKIGAGVVGGLLAGLVFGILMQIMTTPMPMADGGPMPMAEGGRMPMMAMVAQVVRSDSLAAGWVILVFTSVVTGGIFGWALGSRAARIRGGLAWGALYGLFLWILAGLILMPIFLGMAAFAPVTMASMRPGAMGSLVAHLLSGLILGGVFAGLYGRGPAVSQAVPRA